MDQYFIDYPVHTNYIHAPDQFPNILIRLSESNQCDTFYTAQKLCAYMVG